MGDIPALNVWLISGVFLVALIILWLVVTKKIDIRGLKVIKIIVPQLGIGWQLYSYPTTLEPPGHVFRFDEKGTIQRVEDLKVNFQVGEIVFGKSRQSIEMSMNTMARILGLILKVSLTGKRTEILKFEIKNPQTEVLLDMELAPAFKAFKEERLPLIYRADNRYFVIRETITAEKIKFRLNGKHVASVGGHATVAKAARVKGTLFSSRGKNDFELSQPFGKRMRVLFKAEEIKLLTAPLAGESPKFGLFPVEEELIWDEK